MKKVKKDFSLVTGIVWKEGDDETYFVIRTAEENTKNEPKKSASEKNSKPGKVS